VTERPAARPGPDAEAVAAAERWFLQHGLPYFVQSEREAARRGLDRSRVLSLLLTALAVGVGAGVAVGLLLTDVTQGLGTALLVTVLLLAWYAAAALRITTIVRWAVSRTFRSLGQLFPLVTRALPLLLLFITFLFINAEVWEVSSRLDGGVLWVTVMLFSGLAVGFLVVRLPEELDRVDAELEGSRLADMLRDTPLEGMGRGLSEEERELSVATEETHVAGFQRANLVLVLLVTQIVQVLLLAVAVLVFFLVFGVLTMQPEIIAGWTGERAHFLEQFPTLSVELLQVSTFLAAFSGLYFTVYAVTDETYRQQFFSSVTHELEQAVGMRAVYRALKRRGAEASG